MKVRVYEERVLSVGDSFALERTNVNYIANVLRLKHGAEINVFNECSGEFLVRIEDVSTKKVLVRVLQKLKDVQKPQCEIVLAFCPLLKQDSNHQLVSACTQIGVHKFLPITSDYTNQRKLNLQKAKHWAVEDCKQSLRIDVPSFMGQIKFEEFFAQAVDKKTTLHEELSTDSVCAKGLIIWANEKMATEDLEKDTQPENHIMKLLPGVAKVNPSKVFILIGPEAGFSIKESALLKAGKNIIEVSLGKNILRSQNAAAACCFAAVSLF